MQGFVPDPEYDGVATADDWVLAIGINNPTNENDYVVCQEYIVGIDSQLNPTTQDKTYIRTGTSTTKTGTQRNFAITGDRKHKSEFQDYCLSHAIIFGTGQSVVVPYVYFSCRTGKGEKGTASIIVNSDGGGNAGENSAISIDLKSVGTKPTEYTYTTTSV